ncbi:ABC transporter ATP-binding protein [Baekduia soli]|uniref:ABC transporter ATP-binding protein n=1 Tax=Baekduia soli TaxID=496014 RepID=A0A5B8TZT4_9ACTN|nr:ABC transporter ATP-binding protein [Baekduia soli]QEC46247.1 ABC transporter ATP-binding protein [Baekduia soli]
MSDARPAAFAVTGLSKEFRIPHEQVHTLKERVLHPLRRPGHERLRVLDDVDFHVEQGEFFGIIGRNGSGKSTLLKCLAGIYRADAGRILVNGRVSTFIELGVGFNMDLPARDNILINATMLGLSQREARSRIDSVLEFAELHDFVDLKLKNYSSGMLVRLAFSVMIQVDADILLIDEVLAVGDAAFQQKCYDEFGRLRREGRTVILVTHEMASVQRFCDRAMLLENGRVANIGEPEPVSSHYLRLNFSHDARAAEAARARAGVAAMQGEPSETGPTAAPSGRRVLTAAGGDEVRAGDAGAEIIGGWFVDADEQQVESLEAGRRVTFNLHVRFHEDARGPVFVFMLRNSVNERAIAATTEQQLPYESYRTGEEVVVRFGFHNVLAPDQYTVSALVARPGAVDAWMDNRERFMAVAVTSSGQSGALLEIPFDVSLRRDVVETA